MALPEELLEKRDQLLKILEGYGRVAVAFSGGVDSALLAKAAALACGDSAIAVTAVSASLSSSELDAAKQTAAEIGIQHQFIQTHEFEDPNYVSNPNNRCYFCKSELYLRLELLLPELNVDVMLNGANWDDRGDYRPGMTAADEHRVASPLLDVELTKAEVRLLAQDWQLSVWDKPASPCLASRIAYGIEVTPERVARVERAEKFLRDEFQLQELRVRLEANELARIEVPEDEIPRLVSPVAKSEIVKQFQELGFRFVTIDLEGFRSGSMNTFLPVEVLEIS